VRRFRVPPNFFTVVTYRRGAILCDPEHVRLLRDAFRTVRHRHPFSIDAFVLLPDHLHCLWTLPPDDYDYPTRWMLIKSYFTRRCAASLETARPRALRRKRAQPVWQQRYWEHRIRDERDFARHCDYIHYNPVKHGNVAWLADWPYSSFHRFVRNGVYPACWDGGGDLSGGGGLGE
jgi:putative transposase